MGKDYYFALVGGTLIIIATLLLIVFLIFAIFPDFYRSFVVVSARINGKLLGLAIVGVVFLLLRSLFKKEDLEGPTLTQEIVLRGINFILVYTFSIIFVIGIIGMKFLRHYYQYVNFWIPSNNNINWRLVSLIKEFVKEV